MRLENGSPFEHLFAILCFNDFIAATFQDRAQKFTATQRIVSDQDARREVALGLFRSIRQWIVHSVNLDADIRQRCDPHHRLSHGRVK